MSKVFVNVAMSLDGYASPEGMTLEHWKTPGGETGPVNDTMRQTNERIGANIMGKRMFEQGAASTLHPRLSAGYLPQIATSFCSGSWK